jgi:hypothetical protein
MDISNATEFWFMPEMSEKGKIYTTTLSATTNKP